MSKKLIKEFLKESNAIENVWDKDSLTQALYAWEFIEKEKKLSPSIILKTHKILMLHQKLLPNEKGYFRTVQVWVGGREGKPWYAVPELVKAWCTHANERKIEDEIKEDHIEFERIHPFVDGNGRVGRILYLWQRIKAGLPIEVIYEKEKGRYYSWFDTTLKMW